MLSNDKLSPSLVFIQFLPNICKALARFLHLYMGGRVLQKNTYREFRKYYYDFFFLTDFFSFSFSSAFLFHLFFILFHLFFSIFFFICQTFSNIFFIPSIFHFYYNIFFIEIIVVIQCSYYNYVLWQVFPRLVLPKLMSVGKGMERV